jgi:hypothetical protein
MRCPSKTSSCKLEKSERVRQESYKPPVPGSFKQVKVVE